MILTVTLNPSVDHAIFLERLKLHDTNRVMRTETDAGGKGINLARVAAELGADVLATGFLGGGNGAYVRKVLDKQGVKHEFIEVDGDTRTNLSVEDDSDDPPTTFNEPGPIVDPGDLQALIDKCEALSPPLQVARLGEGGRGERPGDGTSQVTWAALGGSLPPGAPDHALATLIAIFKKAGCNVALDADGDPLRHGLKAGPDLIKPNAKEAERLLGRPIESTEDALAAARELQAKAPIVIVSLGEDGAVMICKDGAFIAESPKVDVKSTIGSGDSMIGAMLWAIEEGKSLEETFRWGVAAGAATASTDGSEIARQPKILELLPLVKIDQA